MTSYCMCATVWKNWQVMSCLGLKFVKLSIRPTLFVHFASGQVGRIKIRIFVTQRVNKALNNWALMVMSRECSVAFLSTNSN